jgi:hypothetical protein
MFERLRIANMVTAGQAIVDASFRYPWNLDEAMRGLSP